MTIRNGRSGFTIIELLVVIAIIGLAASITLVSLSGARKKSRDARRLADLKQLHNALQLYVNDNKTSPTTVQGFAALVPGHIAAIPPEPRGGAGAYGYVKVGASGYTIGAILEGAGQAQSLNADYDGALAITINGTATNCNALAGQPGEVVYCENWQ